MRQTLLYFMLLFLCNSAFGQTRDYVKEMENNDLLIRQKPNTEGLLTNYLHGANMEEDTVYAIIYFPAACPRCEAAIPNFYRLLKANSPGNKMLLITVNSDSVASSAYIKRNNYVADYYKYDTDDSYRSIFSFNTEDMMGTYILKLCPKEGVMLTGGEYTVLGRTFVKQLRSRKDRIAPHLFATDTRHEEEFVGIKPTAKAGNWTCEDLPLEANKELGISNVYGIPQYKDGYFLYTDILNNAALLFKRSNGRLVYKKSIEANEREKKAFVEISSAMYEQQVRQGNVFYIPLQARLLDTATVVMSYSLPKITVDKNGTDLAFYNAPAILVRSIGEEKDSILPLDFDLEHSEYFHPHFNFDVFNKKVWVGSMKLTWPMDGFTKEDYGDNVELNPFDDRFYGTFNPIIVSFDAGSGKVNGHYGKLEESQRLSKTGYFFLNNVYTHHGRYFLFSNGYTGKMYVADSTQMGKKYQEYDAFEINPDDIPEPDSSKFYQMEYGTLYDKTFSRCISEVKMDDKNIYCLVIYGRPRSIHSQKDAYSFVVIDRKTNKRQERLLTVTDADRILGYGIGEERGEFFPFAYLKKNGGYLVRQFH